MKIKNKGITASDLKYIAILAMLIDHVAWLFIPDSGFPGQTMHFAGRITAPVMCFFISEGYHHTHNLKRYFGRMCVFAVISHFAYAYCFNGGFFQSGNESMITTLTLCLMAVHVLNSSKISNSLKFPVILFIAYFSEYCDWGFYAVIFTVAFELSRGSRKNQLIAYAATAFLYIMPLVRLTLSGNPLCRELVYQLGIFLSIPLIALYNGEKGGGKYTKWVFYIFYPAHLLFLGYINFNY